MSVDNMTLEEVKQRLADLVKQHDLAVQELEKRKEQAKCELTQQIKDLVAAQGYSMEEVLPMLTPKKRGSSTTKGKKDDLPRRLKKKMIALGLDPNSTADRIRFIDELASVDAEKGRSKKNR